MSTSMVRRVARRWLEARTEVINTREFRHWGQLLENILHEHMVTGLNQFYVVDTKRMVLERDMTSRALHEALKAKVMDLGHSELSALGPLDHEFDYQGQSDWEGRVDAARVDVSRARFRGYEDYPAWLVRIRM